MLKHATNGPPGNRLRCLHTLVSRSHKKKKLLEEHSDDNKLLSSLCLLDAAGNTNKDCGYRAHFARQTAAVAHTPRCTPSYAGDWRRAACLAFNMLHCQYLQMWMLMSTSAAAATSGLACNCYPEFLEKTKRYCSVFGISQVHRITGN